MEACSDRKGQIATAEEVGRCPDRGPYVCINLRKRWQWQPVRYISGNTFKDIRDEMYKYIHNCLQNRILSEKEFSVMISGCIASSSNIINGKWKVCSNLVKYFVLINI